jgi:hypothetical protein
MQQGSNGLRAVGYVWLLGRTCGERPRASRCSRTRLTPSPTTRQAYEPEVPGTALGLDPPTNKEARLLYPNLPRMTVLPVAGIVLPRRGAGDALSGQDGMHRRELPPGEAPTIKTWQQMLRLAWRSGRKRFESSALLAKSVVQRDMCLWGRACADRAYECSQASISQRARTLSLSQS